MPWEKKCLGESSTKICESSLNIEFLLNFPHVFVDFPRSLQGFLNFPELCNNFPSIFKKNTSPDFSHLYTILQNNITQQSDSGFLHPNSPMKSHETTKINYQILRASPPNRSSRRDLLGRIFPPLNDPTWDFWTKTAGFAGFHRVVELGCQTKKHQIINQVVKCVPSCFVGL